MEGFQGKPIGYNITYQSTDVKSRIYFAKVNHTTNISTLGRLTVYAMYEIFEITVEVITAISSLI